MSDAATARPLSQGEISRMSNDLTKAMNQPSTEPDALSRILKDLHKGVAASEDLLRSTRIGIIVNKLKEERYCKDERVRSEAMALIKKWKQDINNAKKRSGNAGSESPKPAANPSSGASTPAVKKEAAAAADEKWRSNKPEARNVNTDGVDYQKLGNKARDGCVKLLYDGVAFMSDQPPAHLLQIALSIEKECFTTLGPEKEKPYGEKVRMLFLNLKNKGNAGLRAAVAGPAPTIQPAKLIQMTAEQMKSEEMKAADAALHKENINNAMTAKEDKAISSMLQCGSCGQKKVSYTQAQTRSADEPMTTFCECTVCGKKWKFS